MTHKQIKSFLFTGTVIFFLSSCGTDRIYDITPLPEEVYSVKSLPNCNYSYDGDSIYVKEIDKVLVCSADSWKDPSPIKSSSSRKNSSKSSSSSYSSSSRISREYVLDKSWPYKDQYVDGGTLTDKRDNQKYPTVIINNRRWMAANLRFTSEYLETKTACYKNKSENCKTMGPMYHYSVKGIPTITKEWYWEDYYIFREPIFPPRENICPEGWRLPNSDDWKSLEEAAKSLTLEEFENNEMSALLDSSWNLYKDTLIVAGTNRLGFNIIGNPVVFRDTIKYAIKADSIPYWYTIHAPYTTDVSKTTPVSHIFIFPWAMYFNYSGDDAPDYAFIRCIEKDESDIYEIKQDTIIDNRYGDVYKIIKAGPQWWFAEDLHFKENPDACHPYEAWEESRNKCQYTYYDAMEYPKPNYNCPEGWTLPTKYDWFNLFYYIDMSNGNEDLISSVLVKEDSTGTKPSPSGLDLVDGGSYFTISTGSESIALSNIPLQYLVDTQKSGFFYGQSFLHNKYASRIRCIKIQVEE